MIADFGIALAISSSSDASRLTEPGLSPGTPQYMSPEQASGEENVTARSDIYALGCVLFEMLTGEPPFSGPTAQTILAKMMSTEVPPVTALRRTVPEYLSRATSVALQKIPADRFASARDFADAITGTRPITPQLSPVVSGPAATQRDARGGISAWRAMAPWLVAVASVTIAVWAWIRPREWANPLRVGRFEIDPPDGVSLSLGSGPNIAISPDGDLLAFVGGRNGVERSAIYLRQLSSLSSQAIAGTQGGSRPTFSPDGRWLLFQRDGLWKVRLPGGAPIVVVGAGLQPSWGEGGRIVFARDHALWWVNDTGGSPQLLTMPDSSHHADQPDVLPGGSTVVFALRDLKTDDRELAAVRIRDGRIHRLGILGSTPRFLAGGYLVFARPDGTAWALRFDPERLTVTGPEVRVLERVYTGTGGAVELAIARNGTAAYIESWSEQKLALVDHEGRSELLTDSLRHYSSPRFSPDGGRLAVAFGPTFVQRDVWIYSIASRSFRRVTHNALALNTTEWSADGRFLAWTRRDSGRTALEWQPVDGAGGVTTLATAPELIHALFSPDGRYAVAVVGRPGLGTDIASARLDSLPLRFRSVVGGSFASDQPALSRDGRWLAYTTNETGRNEIYVRPLDGSAKATRVSVGGASDPRWAPDGRTLYYRSPQRLVAARFAVVPIVVTRDSLFSMDPYPDFRTVMTDYDLSPDGRRFLFRQSDQLRRLVVVVSWPEEIRQRFVESGLTR
jgi:serine/threonine-protein kinase